MRYIWKFRLVGGRTTIKEKVIEWLSVGYDPSGNICVWAIVEPEADANERVEYDILKIGTGWNFNQDELDNMEFIGSINDGPFMWHIFINQQCKFKEKTRAYDDFDEEDNYDHANMTVNLGGMTFG